MGPARETVFAFMHEWRASTKPNNFGILQLALGTQEQLDGHRAIPGSWEKTYGVNELDPTHLKVLGKPTIDNRTNFPTGMHAFSLHFEIKDGTVRFHTSKTSENNNPPVNLNHEQLEGYLQNALNLWFRKHISKQVIRSYSHSEDLPQWAKRAIAAAARNAGILMV